MAGLTVLGWCSLEGGGLADLALLPQVSACGNKAKSATPAAIKPSQWDGMGWDGGLEGLRDSAGGCTVTYDTAQPGIEICLTLHDSIHTQER